MASAFVLCWDVTLTPPHPTSSAAPPPLPSQPPHHVRPSLRGETRTAASAQRRSSLIRSLSPESFKFKGLSESAEARPKITTGIKKEKRKKDNKQAKKTLNLLK